MSDRNESWADLAGLILSVARDLQRTPVASETVLRLSLSEGGVMRYIDSHPGATASEIAVGTGLKRSNVSVALRTLITKDMIDRYEDPDDGRSIRVYRTERAVANLESVRQGWSELLSDAAGGDADGLDDAVALFKRIEEGLSERRYDADAELTQANRRNRQKRWSGRVRS